jgi:hypothetical protein
MTVGRRDFLSSGLATAGAGLALLANSDQAATAAAITPSGRSVLEFGVVEASDALQTAALQKAIDEIARSGNPVFIPGGRYVTGTLKLPAGCMIIGVPGATRLAVKDIDTAFDATGGAFSFSGLTIEGSHGAADKGRGLITASRAELHVANCKFFNAPAHALRLTTCGGALHSVEIQEARGMGVWGTDLGAFTVSQCRINAAQADGIQIASGRAPGAVLVTHNHIARCRGAGIAVAGNGIVNGNFVFGSARFGMKLGNGLEGHIMASGNLVRECGVGIGVTASGETIFATLNLINAPRDGGIRAFDGDKLLGLDLTRQSPEAYLNLTVAGNVVR